MSWRRCQLKTTRLDKRECALQPLPDGGALKSSGGCCEREGSGEVFIEVAVYQRPVDMAGLSLFTLLLLLAWVAHRSRGYVIVNSVSWAITNQEETVSTEDDEEEEDGNVLPNRLFQSGGSIWKASYPAAAYQQRQPRRRGDGEGESRAVAAEMPSHREALGFPSRMFSYRRDGQSVERSSPKQPQQGKARLARHLLSSSTWGFLATLSTLDKIKGLPFGNIFMISDGSPDNSTGAPFFYVSRQDRIVEDLMINSGISLTLSEAEPNYCRHPVMKKWPPEHNWLFMKMNIRHVWLQNWFGAVDVILVEDYFKVNPMNIV
ncbi:protein CREG2 isoform X3 [Amblyraja radiata]|uniref:protein CREG2 isoform X3 n=1 Tax=Amblyraja radiata TaxID=386614 RepID=UPI0014042441|nr:protein CREG2 isoform X3 [Amblyraja radiata]